MPMVVNSKELPASSPEQILLRDYLATFLESDFGVQTGDFVFSETEYEEYSDEELYRISLGGIRSFADFDSGL